MSTSSTSGSTYIVSVLAVICSSLLIGHWFIKVYPYCMSFLNMYYFFKIITFSNMYYTDNLPWWALVKILWSLQPIQSPWPLRPWHTNPILGVRGRQRQSGIRGALLRLVCPAPSSLYGKFSHLPRQLAKESRPKKSLWLAVQLSAWEAKWKWGTKTND